MSDPSIQLEALENKTFQSDDYNEVPPTDIVAYNELRSCADLYRMYNDGTLEIQPEFQREIVWKSTDQTRFVDSLVKKLPIPSMCFSLDYKTEKMQVIDGLQRVATIIQFLSGKDYKGEEWTLSKLDDIDTRLSGRKLAELKEPGTLNELYKRVENFTIPITIIRCDYTKRKHTEFLFTIFHRLNSGGSRLNNQEIRNCIYFGPFNTLLHKLNTNPKWLAINQLGKSTGHRFRYEEIILRMFAFLDEYEEYNGRLAKFLNDYMEKYKSPEAEWLEAKEEIFLQTLEVVSKALPQNAEQKLSVTVLEALLVGISRNLPSILDKSAANVFSYYKKLLNHPEFSEERLKEGLSGKPRVTGRLSAAEFIFSGKK